MIDFNCCDQGECLIRSFDLSANGIQECASITSPAPVTGVASFPKLSLNVSQNEIMKLGLISSEQSFLRISLMVPRKVSCRTPFISFPFSAFPHQPPHLIPSSVAYAQLIRIRSSLYGFKSTTVTAFPRWHFPSNAWREGSSECRRVAWRGWYDQCIDISSTRWNPVAIWSDRKWGCCQVHCLSDHVCRGAIKAICWSWERGLLCNLVLSFFKLDFSLLNSTLSPLHTHSHISSLNTFLNPPYPWAWAIEN